MFAMENLPFFLACLFFAIGLILSISGLRDEKITFMSNKSSIHNTKTKGGFGFGPQSDPKRPTPPPPVHNMTFKGSTVPDHPHHNMTSVPPATGSVSFSSEQKRELTSIIREAMAQERERA